MFFIGVDSNQFSVPVNPLESTLAGAHVSVDSKDG
jgi:hypothetical protein